MLLIDAPESVQSYFWAGNVAVAKSDPRRAALDVTNTLFGGRFTSMLNTELRIRTGLSYGASSHFDRLLQPGHWALSSFTQTDTTIQALDLALATLDKLHESGLDPTMLESGKSYVQGQYPLALETSAQWAVAARHPGVLRPGPPLHRRLLGSPRRGQRRGRQNGRSARPSRPARSSRSWSSAMRARSAKVCASTGR